MSENASTSEQIDIEKYADEIYEIFKDKHPSHHELRAVLGTLAEGAGREKSDLMRMVSRTRSKKRQLQFAVAEAKEAIRKMESIEKYEEKIERSEESLENYRKLDNEADYAELLREDLHRYKQGVKRFKQDRDAALKHFYEYLDDITE